MPTLRRFNVSTVIVVFIVVAMISLSLIISYNKLRALGYHSDFSFYLEFANRASNPNLPNQYSVSPYGKNWLGWIGFEGDPNIHHSVHLEPIKYVYAFLYLLWPSPHILFFFVAVVYFLPLLYWHAFYRATDRLDSFFKWLVIVAYCAYPSVLALVSFDLRTYILLIPFWFLSFLSVHLRRPLWEVVLLFNLAFLAREESIVFGFFLLLYSFFSSQTHRRYTKYLFISWSAWVAATIIYFDQTRLVLEYTVANIFARIWQLALSPVIHYGLLFSLFCVILVTSLKSNRFKKFVPLLAFSLVLVPVFFPFGSSYFGKSIKAGITALLFTDRWMLGIICVLMVIIIAWSTTTKNSRRKIFILLFTVIVIYMGSLSLFSKRSQLHIMSRHAAAAPRNNWLFDFSVGLDQYNDVVLTNYIGAPLFSSFEHAYIFERLPLQAISGGARNWPANKGVIRKLLREKIDYIVVSNKDWIILNSLLVDMNLDSNWVEVYTSDTFTARKINRLRGSQN